MTSVLLYSGGLDSYALAALYRPDVLLYVDLGTEYGKVEWSRIHTPPGLEDRLEYVAMEDLGHLERPGDLILPGRNAHLVLLAANHGDDIYLAATAGDRVKDKDEVFVERMNALLAHLYQPQWWLPEGRDVRLHVPLKALSKRQIVAKCLEAGITGEQLSRDTFSCYHPTRDGIECAECKPCTRKWVALMANGVRPHFEAHPHIAPMLDSIRAGTWDRGGDEARDVLDAVREYHRPEPPQAP